MSRTGLFDSHAHMDSDYFTDDRDALLTQLQEELDGIINPGCDEITSGFAVSLAEKYDFMYAAVGWHPEDLEGILDNSYLDELAAWAVHPKVVAIGEIGLDYYWKGNEPKDVQKRRLLEQLDLAKQFDLAGIWRQQAEKGCDRGAFPGTVGAKQGQYLAGGNVQIDAGQRRDRAVMLARGPQSGQRRLM